MLSTDKIKNLMTFIEPHCVSIYMPTHKASDEVKQDQIRLKNLLKHASGKLESRGLRSDAVQNKLAPALSLIEEMPFWKSRTKGLAVFIANEIFQPFRLPLSFDKLVVVKNRFHIKPLIPLLTGEEKFFVLTLSHNGVQLFQGTRFDFSDIELPASLQKREESLSLRDNEQHLQFHSGTADVQGGKRAAMFHGQGGGKDSNRDEILKYFRQIDKELHSILKNENAPLIFAGVASTVSLYREVNTYAYSLDQIIDGNPELMKNQDLQDRAWQLITPMFKANRQRMIEEYCAKAKTRQTTNKLEEIVLSAISGQVKTLFVALDTEVWGTVNPHASEVNIVEKQGKGDIDLLDEAAIHTLLNCGTVYVVPQQNIPGDNASAAILRY